MRFTTREDVEQPITTVFAAVSDFDAFERAALRRGAEVTRGGPDASIGQSWTVSFVHRGRKRVLEAQLDRVDPPRGLTTSGQIGGLTGVLVLELLALSAHTTRLTVDVDIKPTSISARIFVQSLRLVKASLNNRFQSRVRYFAKEIEARGKLAR